VSAPGRPKRSAPQRTARRDSLTGNPLKQRLGRSERLFGCWLSLASPLAAEALACAGFDFLVVDGEHSPVDTMDMILLLLAIAAGGAQPVLRVAENNAALAKRALDAGSPTLLFPMVASADDARRAVAAMRYPQAGNGGVRGVAGVVRAARFGLAADYVQRANETACTIVQIESAAGVEACPEIAAVDGVDALFVGPADLAASLGHLGASGHVEVQQAIDRVHAAAAAQGKAAGIFAGSIEEARDYAARGFTMVALAADVIWLLAGAKQALDSVRG
jgi:2-dehydro-3-deoxyglucarate aldolase